MEWTVFVVAMTTFALSLYYYCDFSKKNTKYPPGPKGIPYFGSFFSAGPTPTLTFSKWAKQYGSVFSVKIGEVNGVVLNDSKSIREAFKEDAFSGRPDNKFFNELTGGSRGGVAFNDGPDWLEQRRFVMRNLKDFGFGKKSMESLIMVEVDEFVERLLKESNSGQPVTLSRKFSLAILNSLWMISCGFRFKQDDPKLEELFTTFIGTINSSVTSGFLIFLHKMSMMAPGLFGWNKLINVMATVVSIINDIMAQEERTFDASTPPRHFVDVYLTQMKATTDSNSTFYKEKGYKQLEAVLLDFFGAGSETTALTLTWAVLLLSVNPNVQKKMHDEIDEIVGKSRQPTLADKPKLPYTEAVMHEIFRRSTILPLNLFHSTTRNVAFQGFQIPKDTYIIANAYGVHHDPETWKDPHNFRPERFLSEDGTTFIKSEHLIPFSVGKRACIGETLARDSFYLFLTSIFQRFEVSPHRAHEISLEVGSGFTNAPKTFQVFLKDRFVE